MGRAARIVSSSALTVLLVSCDSMTKDPAGPSVIPSACQVSFTLQQSASIPSGGGSGIVSVSASQPQCGWTAATDANWILLAQLSGVGSGDARFSVAANPNPGARQGEVILNDTHFKITQTGASCDVQLSSSAQSAPAAGMSGNVVVTTGSSCSWSATSNVGWLAVMSDPTVTGEGTVQFNAEANPATSARTGLIAIGNQLFTVTQAGK